jgi:hypothetical protein
MEMQASTGIAVGTRLLLRLWRGLHESGYSAEGENWQCLVEACDYHQVSPIVFHRLQSRSDLIVSPEVLEQLRARFYRISAYNHRLAVLLGEIVGQFEQHKIPSLALKGPAVALAAYGDLSLRQYEDIDVMVRVDDLPKAVELLFRRGFQPARGHAHRYENVKLYHEVTLVSSDQSCSVDLHWQLAPPYARAFGPNPEEIWSRATKLRLPGGDVPVLCREDLFLALCQHGTRHRWWQLKWLFDVAELLRKSETLDWSRIDKVMRMSPMALPPASLAALLARDLLGIQVPADVAKILEPGQRIRAVADAIRDEFLKEGQTNRSAHDTLLGLEQRPLFRAAYMATQGIQYPVCNVLFTITEKDLEFVRLPEKLRLLYYIIRPLRLMLQHGRGAARRILSMAR